MELAEGFIHDLVQLEEGVVMYDAHLKTNVLVRAPVILIIGDNPRASEILSHMGSTPTNVQQFMIMEGPLEVVQLKINTVLE